MGNQFKTIALIASIKFILMIFNVVYWVSGMMLFFIGLWACICLQQFFEEPNEFSDTIPYVLIGIGLLYISVSSLSCSCTLKGLPVLLNLYGGILAVIFIMEVGVEFSLYAYKQKLAIALDRGLTFAFLRYLSGNPHMIFDFGAMQTSLKCCGMYNSTDWSKVIPVHPIPLTCCKDLTNCVTAKQNDIFTQGCFNYLVTFFEDNFDLVLCVAAGISAIPLTGALLSCCLANQIKKAKNFAA